MDEPLSCSQRALVEANHQLIYGYLHRHGLDEREWYDVLAVALCEAARRYDPEKGAFTTFAYLCFTCAVGREFEHGKRRKRSAAVLSLHALEREYEDTGKRYEFPLTADEPGFDAVETRMCLDAFAEQLKVTDRAVFDLLRQGLPQCQIADRLGVSRQAVSQRIRRIRRKYNELMKGS